MTSLRLRLSSRIRPGLQYAIARTPSHLTSKLYRASSRGSPPASASIGTIRSGIGSRSWPSPTGPGGSIRWIIQSFGLP